ncbi:uncharacterized protein LOC135714265 isoform X2 [Ochlerotatus camptorhynchus]|uniref:uncharacterized protein LOC135714265 isoform X2 n=1 Tax=Ochlerotatus camptorhynchus TaxID=644619 RepID=UPI0031D32FF0
MLSTIGNNMASIFVPNPPAYVVRRVSKLPGAEGSSQVANTIINYTYNKPWTPPLRKETQCSEYLAEIAQLNKKLIQQQETCTNKTQKSSKQKTQGTKKALVKESEKSSGVNRQHDVYFSSRKTYNELMKLFNKVTLSGVDSKIKTNAEYYLHHLKMNLLVLTSNIQEYSKIEDCFKTFVIRTQQLRDYMTYYYDSCKAHYEQTCNSNVLVSYQDGLHELEYMIAECIRQRLN